MWLPQTILNWACFRNWGISPSFILRQLQGFRVVPHTYLQVCHPFPRRLWQMRWGHSGFGGLPTTRGIKTIACHVTRSHDPCGNPEEESQSEREFPSLSVVSSEKMSQTYRCSTHSLLFHIVMNRDCLTHIQPRLKRRSAARGWKDLWKPFLLSKTLCLAQFRASPPLFTHRAQHLLEIEPSCKSSSSKRGDKNAKSETITGCEDVGWERREL